MYIELIKYPNAPDCLYNGTEILTMLIEAAKEMGVREIELEDVSVVQSNSGGLLPTNIPLSIYSALKHGRSWYEAFGFEQENKEEEYDRRLEHIRSTPLVQLLQEYPMERVQREASMLMRALGVDFDLDNAQEERTIVDLFTMLSTRNPEEAEIIDLFVKAFKPILKYKRDLILRLPPKKHEMDAPDQGSEKRRRMEGGRKRKTRRRKRRLKSKTYRQK